MFPVNILPGQGFKPFDVYETVASLTASGRAVTGAYKKTRKKFFGILVNASQREIDQWKQNGHPITHKIIQYSATETAKATDCLTHDGKDYYVQGRRNPGMLDVTNVYFVEERLDIKKEKSEG